MKNTLPRAALVCMLLLAEITVYAAPCLDEIQLRKLEQAEWNYLQDRVPPAFRHAAEDQRLKLRMSTVDMTTGQCTVQLNMELPMNDVEEANAVLDKEPAKRIVLASQGYAVPDQPQLVANFEVNPATLAVPHQETLQTAELGKLRASVEMVYALLSQSRASIEDNLEGKIPWTQAFADQRLQSCKANLRTSGDAEQACTCRNAELAKHYSQRNMQNIDYVKSNPYAQATGAATSFAKIEAAVNAGCGLQR